MAEKILGLDIGSYSIKATVFEATFSSFELTDLFESTPLRMDELEESDKKTVIMEAIMKMLQENDFDPKVIVTSLSGTQISTRIIELPLPENQVAKVLPFEMEAYLPFDVQDVVIDYHVIESTKTLTKVLAAAAQKKIVSEHLETLRGAGVEPAFVTLDSASLYNVSQFTSDIATGSYVIVDIGHTKTSICLITNGVVSSVRSIFLGGGHITDQIRRKLDLTLDQAVDVKHKHGIIEIPSSPLRSEDLKRLSQAIREVLDPLTQQIQQTLGSFLATLPTTEADESRKIEAIYLCGGSSSIRNLPEYFQNYLNIPTSTLELFKNYPEISERLQNRVGTFAHSIGLGLRAAARGATAKKIVTLNFRKDEFAFAKDITGLKNQAFFFGKWAAIIFICALLAQVIKMVNLTSEKAKVEEAVIKEYKRIVPDDKKPPKTPALALKSLQSKVNAFKQKQEVLTAGLTNTTALGVLLKISNLIPADIKVDTTELAIDRNKVTFRGLADTFESVDRIVGSLQKDAEFSHLEKGDIKEAADNKKAFAITITIEDPNEKKPKAAAGTVKKGKK